MKKLATVSALSVFAACLYAQGLDPGSQTKESWEEINFEFNSSVLTDGYPSLLRLAEILGQHRDFKVLVTGYADSVGSQKANQKISEDRAKTVKAFLVKYGAQDSQITTSGVGARNPTADNRSKEGRFMNRRVVLSATDGTGKVVKEGGAGEVVKALDDRIADLFKKQEDCCNQILKRLDKLDDILAAINNLKGENDKLQAQVNELRNQQNGVKQQVAELPKPLSEQQTKDIAHTEATGALDEAARRNRKFSLMGMNLGRAMQPGRTGDLTFSGRARYFAPFGGAGTSAIQAQGEFMYTKGLQEGQFDIGLVNRWKNVQAGAFASFKYLNFAQYQNGGTLGQAALMVDYILPRGRIGAFATQGFKNYAALNNVQIVQNVYWQTYARVIDQYGASFLHSVWGDAYVQGSAAYLRRRDSQGSDRPGITLKLTQPVAKRVSLTAETGYNETYLNAKDSSRIAFGVEFGDYIHPKDYRKVTSPVPMDVPRIRYELGVRRVGNAPPVADAGPNQLSIPAGTVTLNGTGSYDPLGLAITYAWAQISGPAVTLSDPSAAVTTFQAASGQTYRFRLTVKNSEGISASSTVSVSTVAAASARIAQFNALPAAIVAGGSTTLNWSIENATAATITPGVGTVDARTGSVSVSPAQTTTYTITATGATGTVTATVTVTVGADSGTPQIQRFVASPDTISQGGQSTLSWSTSGGSTVTISGIGSVPANGSIAVSPTQTTTYTLTVTSANSTTATAPVTVTVNAPGMGGPQIIRFSSNPLTIAPGGSATLSWTTAGASSVSISGVGSVQPNGSATVSPTQTTTYVMTAASADGKSVTAPITVTVAPSTVPQIASFMATPGSVEQGSSAQLCWNVTNATSVSIAPGVGVSLGANDCVSIMPSQTTTYTLTAINGAGQVQANTTVLVGGALKINSFYATPPYTVQVQNPTTLVWDTTGATSVVITGNGITPQTLPASGSLTVKPYTTQAYTLTAYGAGGQTVSAVTTVTVLVPPIL